MLKKLLNRYEHVTEERLQSVCAPFGAHVYAKVRVADVVPIENSGISREQYSFALKAHFDFVICNEDRMPQFVVEFDGSSHRRNEQQRRDALKDQICDRFDLPILRINSRHLFMKIRSYDLLTWLVEHWFLRKGFYDAQERGELPFDEPYDPMMFIMISGREGPFPMWLSVEIRTNIELLHRQGKLKDSHISEWIGTDETGHYHGLAWLRINDQQAVSVESGMRKQRFPMPATELLSEILASLLYEQLKLVLAGSSAPEATAQIDQRLQMARKKYSYRSSTGRLGA